MALRPDGPHGRPADIRGGVGERVLPDELVDQPARQGRVVLDDVVVALVTGEGIGGPPRSHAPEEDVEGQARVRRDAVRDAGELKHRVAEEQGLGVEKEGEEVVVPERVDLGDIPDVEAGVLKTRQIEEKIQEGPHVEHVVVSLREHALGRLGGPLGVAREKPVASQVRADQVEAPGVLHGLDDPRGLPERRAESYRRPADADGARYIIAGGIDVRAEDGDAADGDGEYAIPADVGDRVEEVRRAGRPAHGGPARG